jgi:hypothetical protein
MQKRSTLLYIKEEHGIAAHNTVPAIEGHCQYLDTMERNLKLNTHINDRYNEVEKKELAMKMQVAEIQEKNEELRTFEEKDLLKGWNMYDSTSKQLNAFREIKTYQQQQFNENLNLAEQTEDAKQVEEAAGAEESAPKCIQ